jgi:multidrug transporter EmrE-like cation transporter
MKDNLLWFLDGDVLHTKTAIFLSGEGLNKRNYVGLWRIVVGMVVLNILNTKSIVYYTFKKYS